MTAVASDSRILSFWYRLPLVVRSLVSGLVVFEVLQFGWVGAMIANTKVLPQVPWNVAAGLLFLWLVFKYFNGRGWPASTAEARRVSMRSGRLSREKWLWSFAYCGLVVVLIAAIINVVYRFIEVPASDMMDLSMFPWWTLYPTLIMLSINAGVSEEAGFRGYMQGEMERRYGPVTAIAFTSIVFWLAHLNHPSGMARVVMLIAYGVALGALTWAVQTIWPAIIAHSLTDALSFVTIAADTGQKWFMRKPPPFAETGIDTPFVVYSLLLVLTIPAGIAILKRLRAT